MSEEQDNIIDQKEPIEVLQTSSRKTIRPSIIDIENMLSQTINLSNGNIYHEPTCPICSCPARQEIEKEFITRHDYTWVKTTLKNRYNLETSDIVIDNHIENHALRGVKELQKMEYVGKIKRLSGTNQSTLEKIDLCCKILINQVVEVNGLSPNSGESVANIEKIKSAETSRLMSVLNQMLKLQASILGEMKNSGEIISIPMDEFVSVFNDALTSARTDGERAIVKKILDSLNKTNRG